MKRKTYQAAFITDEPYFIVEKELSEKRSASLHTHDFYELMLVKSNRLLHHVNGGAYCVLPGSLVFCGPSQAHYLENMDAKETVSFFNIAFSRCFFEECLRMLSGNLSFSFLDSGHIAVSLLPFQFDLLCAKLRQASSVAPELNSPLKLAIMKSFLWEALLLLYQGKTAIQPGAPLWLENACAQMRDQKNLSVGLPKLVALSGKTQEHLSRCIKRHYELTPTQYINALRIQKAADLLIKTNFSIASIAFDVGYKNYSHFQKQFHQLYRRTPVEYRKMYSNTD